MNFIVATNNYRASGGGNFPGLDGTKTIYASPDANRDVLISTSRSGSVTRRQRQRAQLALHEAGHRGQGGVQLRVGRCAGHGRGVAISRCKADDGSGKNLSKYKIDLNHGAAAIVRSQRCKPLFPAPAPPSPPTRPAPPCRPRGTARRLPRMHPLFAAASLAVAIAAAGVAGAALWRHKSDARQIEIAQWQRLAASTGDAPRCASLPWAAAGEMAARAALGETLMSQPTPPRVRKASAGCAWQPKPATFARTRAWQAAMLGGLASGQADFALAWQQLRRLRRRAMSAPPTIWACCIAAAGRDANPAERRAGCRRLPKAGWRRRCSCWPMPTAQATACRATTRARWWCQAAAEREHPAATQALAMAYRDGELGLRPTPRTIASTWPRPRTRSSIRRSILAFGQADSARAGKAAVCFMPSPRRRP
jgi:hypothetical protein